MAVEIHVACRRDPSAVAQIVKHGRLVHVEVGPARSICAWSPRAHATLLLRERDVAGVVTLRSADRAFATECAELVARAFEGVAVIDGEVLELAQHHPITPGELRTAWSMLEGRDEPRRQPRRGRDADNRDYSTH